MNKKEFETWKQQTEEKILKLQLDTERRFNATAKLLGMGAKTLIRLEDKIDHLVENMITPQNGGKKK